MSFSFTSVHPVRYRLGAAVTSLVLLVGTACASTNQQKAEAEAEEVAQEKVDDAAPKLRVNKKGQVVDAKGRVVKGARVTKSGKIVDAQGDVIAVAAGGKNGGGKKGGGTTLAAGSRKNSGQSGGGPRGGGGGRTTPSCSFDGCTRAAGVSSDEIKVGFLVAEDAGATLAAYGAPVNYGNGKRQVTALVDDLNRRGGILGRKVIPVFGAYRAQENPQSQAARLCTQFTEDEPVFAVISFGGSIGDFRTCLAERHTFLIDHTFTSRDDTFMRELAPWFLLPANKTESRLWQILVPTLKRQGYFGRNPKLGLVTSNRPEYARLARDVVKPLLRKAGIQVEDEVTLNNFDLADSQSQTSQAVLRFKSKGITHVLFVPSYGSAYFFMQNAESQSYRPRYAIDSSYGPAVLLQDNVPNAQLRGSIGIGWSPMHDVDDRHLQYSAQEQRCFKILKSAGESVKGRGSPATGLVYCNGVWVFEAAAKKGGRSLTAGSWLAGLRAVGTSLPSALTFHADFSRGRPDGSYAYRELAFNDRCNCFVYTSGVMADGT